MRRILICTGVLGGGTAVTFVAAALAATILPGGTVVPSSMNVFQRDIMAEPGIAVPAPDVIDPDIVIEDEELRVEEPAEPANGG